MGNKCLKRKIPQLVVIENNSEQSTQIDESRVENEPEIKKEEQIQSNDQFTNPLTNAYYQQILGSQAYRSLSNLPGSKIIKKAIPNTSDLSQKIKRIQKEAITLTKNLPVYDTNSIFVIGDESNTDHMQALIFGSKGTPYEHGAFLFEILFQNNYPNSPPEMKLLTTGKDTIRFNPNLYSNGYVCLSLLGTWSGSGGENWNAATSSVLQVLVSIQSLVMNENILYQEPSYNSFQNVKNPQYQLMNEGYCNIVKASNIRLAMIDIMKNPPKGFEDIIKTHFYLNKNNILKTVDVWIQQAENTKAQYTSLVSSHNYMQSNRYTQDQKAYLNDLKDLKKQLISQLNNIQQKDIMSFKFVQQYLDRVKQKQNDLNKQQLNSEKQEEKQSEKIENKKQAELINKKQEMLIKSQEQPQQGKNKNKNKKKKYHY